MISHLRHMVNGTTDRTNSLPAAPPWRQGKIWDASSLANLATRLERLHATILVRTSTFIFCMDCGTLRLCENDRMLPAHLFCCEIGMLAVIAELAECVNEPDHMPEKIPGLHSAPGS